MPDAILASAIVELCPHGMKAPARDAIGAALLRADQPALSQLAEGVERTIAEDPAFSRDARHVRDFSLFVLFNENVTAARERMQRSLFELRDIHG